MSLPSFDLSGRVALITGAARGIGLAIAQAYAAAGCAVAIQDIDLDAATREATGLESSGHRAIALGGDIKDISLATRLIEQTIESLGGLHILVNNAAVQEIRHWTELSAAEIETTLRADLVAPLVLSQHAAPTFIHQRWGRIINIGSVQQRSGNPKMLPYSMSKAALFNQTTALARDLGPHNITVNLIAPGYFDTLRNAAYLRTPGEKAKAAEKLILRRLGEPRDCTGLALLLASDAGSYITGQYIGVDGGIAI